MAGAITVASSADAQTPFLLLEEEETVDGALDYKGNPAIRSKHGRWKSASFIIGVEVAERIAYYGITSNLISYLTGPLGQSTASAAANVNAWSGFASLFPVIGAIIADSFLGRYRTIIVSSFIYILGLALLTLSAVLPFCKKTTNGMLCDSLSFQTMSIFFSLYLVAVGQSGHKPCVQAFGADQFDGQDPQESKAKSSFFNWWYMGMCLGPLLVISVLNYVQDNVGWGLGFGIPCIIMTLALLIFLLGSPTYRHIVTGEDRSAFVRIGRVLSAAAMNWHIKQSTIDVEEEAQGFCPSQGSEQFRFLDKALFAPSSSDDYGKACCKSEVEEAKAVLRLFPIWATSIVYAIVFSQSSTFFTKQGLTMDRSLGPNFSIPPASLQSFISLSVVLFIPIYDRILVPISRTFTGKPAGIAMLQRIGIGMLISAISMIIAAIVEKKRLETALEYGLIDIPNATVPMSVWWLVPQYVLFGVSDVFTMVGLQEFFYDQVPTELRSVGLSLYLSVFGVGSLLSSLLISVIDKVTGSNGQDSWFSSNLNRGHLDYFYCLLAAISAIEITLFVYFAKCYIYNKKNGL
ncbi:protein NRT1/ PTR FAMILY 5.10 [Beta vulgaris subsp. vulgaris]|uniref:protein NRT1/ PTR FAMILY 5.10 n=1 Tax=Beta vulgaris subsp. vulgaris TaxID=3555 RepID=UPI0020375C08|nr:protein NRT1/ PTR FAMILY 5.10 [Beta vulgaris subsp. vulgaris]